MKALLYLALVSILLSPLKVDAQYICSGQQGTANCPPCLYNQSARTPTKGGFANGQHFVNVFITGSIPNTGFTNGATQGMARWNNATDTTSQPGTTKRPPYNFQPTGLASTSDVVIEFTTDNNKTTSATYVSSENPPRIYINVNHPNWNGGANLDQLAGAVAHELAHDRG